MPARIPSHTRARRVGSRLAGVTCATVALAILAAPARFAAKEALSKDARIALIRGLTSEIAVTKISLPRGKHGVVLDPKGNLNQAQAAKEMRMNGPAINPGMPVEITKISFKAHRVVFEINGGGKRGKKWYQRIQISMGGVSQPVAKEAPVLTYGSWISLKIPDDTQEMTVQQAKNLLASVLDFSRHSPTVLYSPATPPKFKEAIEKHQVLVGMDRDAVLSSKGPPDRKVREDHPDGTQEEDWIYGLPPHVLYVVFEGEVVTQVHQY
jgi:hypothetical protein